MLFWFLSYTNNLVSFHSEHVCKKKYITNLGIRKPIFTFSLRIHEVHRIDTSSGEFLSRIIRLNLELILFCLYAMNTSYFALIRFVKFSPPEGNCDRRNYMATHSFLSIDLSSRKNIRTFSEKEIPGCTKEKYYLPLRP